MQKSLDQAEDDTAIDITAENDHMLALWPHIFNGANQILCSHLENLGHWLSSSHKWGDLKWHWFLKEPVVLMCQNANPIEQWAHVD